MFIMGIDQYGQHYDDLGKYPRKELLARLGGYNAVKTYIDKKDGSMVCTGYGIQIKNGGCLWINLYKMSPLEVEVVR